MTDFKPGDRVKVEFEGEVIRVEENYLDVQRAGGFTHILQKDLVTKLTPKPQPGDVWRDRDGYVLYITWTEKADGTLKATARNGSAEPASTVDFSSAELLFRLPTDQAADTAQTSNKRPPRVFHYGDPEPGPEVKKVKDVVGDVLARGSCDWYWQRLDGVLYSEPLEDTVIWDHVSKHVFPVTEVIEGDDE